MDFRVLKPVGSFAEYQEEVVLRKWARQLEAEAKLPDTLTGKIRRICIYETMRQFMGQSFNRFI